MLMEALTGHGTWSGNSRPRITSSKRVCFRPPDAGTNQFKTLKQSDWLAKFRNWPTYLDHVIFRPSMAGNQALVRRGNANKTRIKRE